MHDHSYAIVEATARLTLLNASNVPRGKCMDGTPGGYYHAANASSRSWIIELEGGGECVDKADCEQHIHSALGSSNFFLKNTTLKFLLQGDAVANPRLHQWNRVYVPYCSQDLWTGQRVAASDETFGYFFSGHYVLEGVLEALDALGLAGAHDIILTGESAGGIGVWPHLDWLAARYPKAKVTGAPLAGFYFFAVPYTGPGHTSSSLADFREEAWPGHYSLWNSTVDASCAAAIEPWRCMLSNYSFPYIETRAFIIEAQTDKVQLEAHDWVPSSQDPSWSAPVLDYFGEWSHNMSVALSPSMAVGHPNGVFSPACFIHTDSWETTLIKGLNYLTAFDRWYFDNETMKLQDDCGLLCNPTCPH